SAAPQYAGAVNVARVDPAAAENAECSLVNGSSLKRYLATLPERVVRSVVGLGAGVAREVGDVALPRAVRQSRLYQNLVDTTLRFLIEQVGEVKGAYDSGDTLADNFLARRTV